MEHHFLSIEFSCLRPDTCEVFVPRRQSVLNGMQEKTIAFSSLTFATVSGGSDVMTETTRVSFGTLSMCLPLETLSHFPLNAGFLSFWTLGY